MKKSIMLLMALLVNFMAGATVALTVGVAPIVGGVAFNLAGAVLPKVVGLQAGLYTEIWTGEMIKAFRNSAESLGWVAKIKDYSQYAENDVIHFVNIGGDPTVLINNTTYPIGVESLLDADKAISLDKYQTKATRITDDEIKALSYDKMASVIERHHEVIAQKKYSRAIMAIAPTTTSATTPVILTTGVASPDGLRKIITRADIISLKNSFDKQKIPVTGRVLVLCSDHANDLLNNDQKFADQYHNYLTGKISNLYGFEVYEYEDCPYYTVSTKTKLAYGAVPTATDRQASVAFYAPRIMKASGTTKAYLSEAKDNPTTQENLANFRHYFIALPLKNEAIGAIISNV